MMGNSSNIRAKKEIPDFLKAIFWEYEFENLDIQKDEELLIAKILRDGNLPALKWLIKTIGVEKVEAWILKTKGKGLTPRQLSFWEIVLSLPHSEVSKWINRKATQIWEKR